MGNDVQELSSSSSASLLTSQEHGGLGELGAHSVGRRAQEVDLERVGQRVRLERQAADVENVAGQFYASW